MRLKKLNIEAFSLLEVLLAAIIFVISIGGLFATLTAVRLPVAQKENALAAAITSKQVLDTLRSQVNATSYYNGCSAALVGGNCPSLDLSLGPHLVPSGSLAGISWPTNLSSLNPTGLSYAVYCADGAASTSCSVSCSTPCSTTCVCTSCSSADVGRGVTLCITSS